MHLTCFIVTHVIFYKEMLLPLIAIHGSNDGIASEDSGPSSGINRITSNMRSSIEIECTNKRLNTIVEIKSRAN